MYGLVATFFCYACCELIKKLGLDDALDVWGVHGMGGWIGSILPPGHWSDFGWKSIKIDGTGDFSMFFIDFR